MPGLILLCIQRWIYLSATGDPHVFVSLPSQVKGSWGHTHLPLPPPTAPWSQGENQGRIRKELGDKHIGKTINTS